jgi:hypothetical protein
LSDTQRNTQSDLYFAYNSSKLKSSVISIKTNRIDIEIDELNTDIIVSKSMDIITIVFLIVELNIAIFLSALFVNSFRSEEDKCTLVENGASAVFLFILSWVYLGIIQMSPILYGAIGRIGYFVLIWFTYKTDSIGETLAIGVFSFPIFYLLLYLTNYFLPVMQLLF